MGVRPVNRLLWLEGELCRPGIAQPADAALESSAGALAFVVPPHSPIPAVGKRAGRLTYLELLCQTPRIEELDTRIRINLQEALIHFIKNEKKWATLSLNEQNKLLKKVATRNNESNPFAERIMVKCQDEKGNIFTRQANLLLDTTRNRNLSVIFDSVVNQQIALIFYEQFSFGLVEHLEKLILLESKMIAADKVAGSDSVVLPMSYIDYQEDLLPLSPRDLELIRENGLGIMAEIIPKILRLPLNKLYYAIANYSTEYPSLALQFYLDCLFSSRERQPGVTAEIEDHVRTLFAKSFYAVLRLGGLTMEQLNAPEPSRSDRFRFFTVGDEDTALLLESNGNSVQKDAIRSILKERMHLENQLRQRREIEGPSVKIELTLEQVLSDIFHVYRDEHGVDAVDELDFLAHTAWLPPKPIQLLSEWEKDTLAHYLNQILQDDVLDRISQQERELIQRWFIIVDREYGNSRTLAQLSEIGIHDRETFEHELLLRLAERHRDIVEQNKEIVVEEVTKQITRMLRVGSITPQMVVQERYDSFHQHVLPHIYYFSTTDAKGDIVWIESPYPLSKLVYLIDRVETMPPPVDAATMDSASLAIAKELMAELLEVELSSREEPVLISEAL